MRAEPTYVDARGNSGGFMRPWQAMRPVVLGAIIGALGGVLGTRFLSALLFGMSPLDLVAYASVATIIAATAFLASYVPARRAARVDPLLALRHE